MKMHMPSIGDKIELSEAWKFVCFDEYRNRDFIMAARGITNLDAVHAVNITLPKGTVLRIDRIYIRKGKKDFDSITFVITSHPTIPVKSGFKGAGRFWVKLAEANKIIFEPYVEPATPARRKTTKS